MVLKVIFSDRAEKDFLKVSKGDRETALRIAETIKRYAKSPAAAFDIKKLQGKYGGVMRLRTGNYRIFFDISGDIMKIYGIRHRQEAYK
jgi:mRNA-degrading endonuclease RelE of RelBE toxin-antitoxin system